MIANFVGCIDEMVQHGDQIYQNKIYQKVEAGNHGKIVAININAY